MSAWLLVGAFFVAIALFCVLVSFALDRLACRINRGRSHRTWL